MIVEQFQNRPAFGITYVVHFEYEYDEDEDSSKSQEISSAGNSPFPQNFPMSELCSNTVAEKAL